MNKQHYRRLRKAIHRVFVDEIKVIPIPGSAAKPLPPLKMIHLGNKSHYLHITYTTLCTECGLAGIYVNNFSTIALCGHCGHFITSLRMKGKSNL